MSNVREKLDKGKAEKDKGNVEFKSGNIIQALRFYHHALLFLTGLDNASMSAFVPGQTLDDNLKKDIKDTLKACYSNMAACYLKQSNYDKAISTSTKVIDLDPTNAKAYYRRGLSRLALNNIDASHADLKRAAELAPQDTGIREELARVTKKMKEIDEKSKAQWRGILLDGGK